MPRQLVWMTYTFTVVGCQASVAVYVPDTEIATAVYSPGTAKEGKRHETLRHCHKRCPNTKHAVQWSEGVTEADLFFRTFRVPFCVSPWISNTVARDQLTQHCRRPCGPVGCAQLSEGRFHVVYPLGLCGPDHPELSKAYSDMAGKTFTDRASRQTQAGMGHSTPAHRGGQKLLTFTYAKSCLKIEGTTTWATSGWSAEYQRQWSNGGAIFLCQQDLQCHSRATV